MAVNYHGKKFYNIGPGGSMVSRYVLQLLFCEKSQLLQPRQPLKLEKKISTDFRNFLMCV
jgi:hypothetical protein